MMTSAAPMRMLPESSQARDRRGGAREARRSRPALAELQQTAGNRAVAMQLNAIAASTSATGTAAARRLTYEAKLREGITLLRAAKPAFGSPESTGKFDSAYWEVRPDPQYAGKLVLVAGTPSGAIDELFAKLDTWSFDCAHYVQVAQLYAFRHTFGAAEFDRRMLAGGPFEIRFHHSSGIRPKRFLQRDGPGERWTDTASGAQIPDTTASLLAAAPIGTRVQWTNLDAPRSSAWRNEQTVKVNDDWYAAHPFGLGSGAMIAEKLAREQWEGKPEPKADLPAYIRQYLFVRQIEEYIVP
jgi:hypothetical protein